MFSLEWKILSNHLLRVVVGFDYQFEITWNQWEESKGRIFLCWVGYGCNLEGLFYLDNGCGKTLAVVESTML